jgi:hypothetical protein
MASELNYTLGLPVNQDSFLSYEQCKLDDTAIFYQGEGMTFRRYARIGTERYLVKETGKPEKGLISILKSGRRV